jgi:hypothetical protein
LTICYCYWVGLRRHAAKATLTALAILRIAKHRALGRALANAGFAGSDYTKRPSREEMLKVERSTAPDPWPADASSQNVVPINQAGQASTKQVNFINTLINKKGLVD